MQKLIAFLLISTSFLFVSCKNSDLKTPADQTGVNTKQQSFFPVTNFILGQLRELDSLPITPLRLVTKGNKTDSFWLKRNDIRTFADAFLHPVIDSGFQTLFAEKSFMDQTINAITLTYDPVKKLPDSIQLNHWDVYINPKQNMVDRIYITKQKDSNGLHVTTQLTWKVNKWYSIRNILQSNTLPAVVSEEKVIWNFDE